MSKKKTDKFMAYKDKFIEGLVKSGAIKIKAEEFWNQLVEFSKYAFNKSHAAAYAYTAFYTAWLKLNYPAEYMTAVLNHTATQKLPALIAECRGMGLEILPPDLNMSGEEFSSDNNRILFGLSKIKGMNDVSRLMEARKQGAFTGFHDFVKRGHSKKTITENLIKSGAMDVWCPNRQAMLAVLENMASDIKEVEKRKEKLKEETDPKKIERLENAIQSLNERFNHVLLKTEIIEDQLAKLEEEYDCLGTYISGHPLDNYSDVKKLRSYPIMDAYEDRNVTICGRIQNVKRIRTKKNGLEMAFFEVADETGSMDVCCFHDTYVLCDKDIQDGAVVAIRGNVQSENVQQSEGDDDAEAFKMIMSSMEVLHRDKQQLLLSGKHVVEWQETLLPLVQQYKGDDCELLFHDKALGEIHRCNFTVSASILNSGLDVIMRKYVD